MALCWRQTLGLLQAAPLLTRTVRRSTTLPPTSTAVEQEQQQTQKTSQVDLRNHAEGGGRVLMFLLQGKGGGASVTGCASLLLVGDGIALVDCKAKMSACRGTINNSSGELGLNVPAIRCQLLGMSPAAWFYHFTSCPPL